MRPLSSPFAEAIAALVRLRGVEGAMIVGEGDGIIVDSTLQIGVRGPAVAALAASLYRKARLSASAAGLGAAAFFQIDAEEGKVFVAGGGELVLVVVAESRANVGLIRMEMLRQAGTMP